jgi:hypothetical protein
MSFSLTKIRLILNAFAIARYLTQKPDAVTPRVPNTKLPSKVPYLTRLSKENISFEP